MAKANRMTDVTDDGEWPWKVKVVTPNTLSTTQYLKKWMGIDAQLQWTPTGNGIRRIESQKLLLQPTGSRMWEIDWHQHERPWPLFRGHLRSCQPLHHIRHWISRKPLVIEAWFQKTTSRKLPMGYHMVTWSVTSRDPKRSNSWPKYA